MNADLTINGLTFKLQYSDKDAGSSRREVSRGVNLPETLTIKSQSYIDSKTKIPGRRTVVREDRAVSDGAGGVTEGLAAYLVVTVPNKPEITTAEVQAVLTRLITLLAGTTVTGGLALSDAIFVNQEQ